MPVKPHDKTWIREPSDLGHPARRCSSIIFAGDFFLAPNSAQTPDRLLDRTLLNEIFSADCAVANLEGPLVGHGRPIPKVGPHLQQRIDAPAMLKSLGFTGVTLANNHAMDFGPDALQHAIQSCRDIGLATAGAGANDSETLLPMQITLPNGVQIALFSACEREFGVADHTPGTAWLYSPQLLPAIRAAKDRHAFVVVCAHGGIELSPLPPLRHRNMLRSLIDHGADLIVAHHPHVPQGWELHRNRAIIYSLGDFYFDHAGPTRRPACDWGYMLRADIDELGHVDSLRLLPYERLNDRIVSLGAQRDRDAALAYLHRLSSLNATDRFVGCWQELAVRLMRERYEPMLRFVFPQGPNYAGSIRGACHALFAAARRSLTRRLRALLTTQPPQPRPQLHQPHPDAAYADLLLLNLLRCESHQACIADAIAVIRGDVADHRSTETRQRVDQLLKQMSTTAPAARLAQAA
jgi:poly-gamma-glutamate synthesis protein (capsule biosynthesis protein)